MYLLLAGSRSGRSCASASSYLGLAKVHVELFGSNCCWKTCRGRACWRRIKADAWEVDIATNAAYLKKYRNKVTKPQEWNDATSYNRQAVSLASRKAPVQVAERGRSNSESAASRDQDKDLQYSSELEVAVPACPLHQSQSLSSLSMIKSTLSTQYVLSLEPLARGTLNDVFRTCVPNECSKKGSGRCIYAIYIYKYWLSCARAP